MSRLPWQWLGRQGYHAGTELQRALRDRLLAGDAGAACLLLLEHEPVITLGRHAQAAHVVASTEALADRGIAVVPTSRGGDVTYHGPGQLMVYPAVRLRGQVAAFLASLAAALGRVAELLGVPGARWRREPAGLWLPPSGGAPNEAKLAACGLHLRRGAVLHGFAFNVSTPADIWRLIVPCGLHERRVTSLAEERARRGLPPPPSVEEVAHVAAPLLCDALAPHLSRLPG